MSIKLYRWILRGLGAMVLLAATVFALIHWEELPEHIPAHYDMAGKVSAYGGRGDLIGLMVTGWIAYAAITVCSLFPQTWNLPVKSPHAYRVAGNVMPILGLCLSLMFSWMIVCMCRGRDLGIWFMPAVLASILIPLLVIILGSVKK